MLAHLGLKVNRLIRVGYGPFSLGNLARGGVAEVSTKRLQEALEGPKKPKAGWAKAKPRPAKPGRARSQQPRSKGPDSNRKGGRAHRRRPA